MSICSNITIFWRSGYKNLSKFTHIGSNNSPSTDMSWMAKRRMIVQIIPRVIFTFPSTISEIHNSFIHWSSASCDSLRDLCAGGARIPSAPMETSFTPLLVMNSSALLTLAILWNRIFPLSGLGNLSPINTTWGQKLGSSWHKQKVKTLRCESHC